MSRFKVAEKGDFVALQVSPRRWRAGVVDREIDGRVSHVQFADGERVDVPKHQQKMVASSSKFKDGAAAFVKVIGSGKMTLKAIRTAARAHEAKPARKPLNVVQERVDRGLLEYSAGRMIFCPSCKKSLDASNAVLVSFRGNHGISCGACHDAEIKARYGEGVNLERMGFEVVDGRSQ